MRYLLDTNVVSELSKPHPDPMVVAWIDEVDIAGVYLSVVTVGEIRKGIARLPSSKRRAYIEHWVETVLFAEFQANIVPFELDMALAWGDLTGRLERAGKRMQVIDSLIAATALQGDFILVTRNEADFAATGVKLLNPWQ